MNPLHQLITNYHNQVHHQRANELAAKRMASAKKAFSMRLQGCSLDDIWKVCGFTSADDCLKAIKFFVSKVPKEEHSEQIFLELSRLDEMQMSLWPKVEKGDVKAVDVCLKIQQQRIKILGLEKPQQIQIQHSTNYLADPRIIDVIAEMDQEIETERSKKC